MAAPEYQTKKNKKKHRARKEIEEIRPLLCAFAFGRHDPTRWLRSRSLRRVPMCPMECIFVPDGCYLRDTSHK